MRISPAARGFPTFYYGPSNETAHADEEWVEVRRLSEAAQVYALAAGLLRYGIRPPLR